MIREATEEDVPVLLEMSMQEAEKQGWGDLAGMNVDRPSIIALGRFHIRHKDAVFLVSERDGEIKGFLVTK